MTQYRKKPVVIEATQWFKDGDHPAVKMMTPPEGRCVDASPVPWIPGLEGGHLVTPGDWIITGVQGETYACKPEIFAATYETAASLAEPPARVAAGHFRRDVAKRWHEVPREAAHVEGTVILYHAPEWPANEHASAPADGWVAGTEDADGNPLVTVRSDALVALGEFALTPALLSIRVGSERLTRFQLTNRLMDAVRCASAPHPCEEAARLDLLDELEDARIEALHGGMFCNIYVGALGRAIDWIQGEREADGRAQASASDDEGQLP